MSKNKIETDQQFVATLNRDQRDYFLNRTTEEQKKFQQALRDLGRGISVVSEYHSIAQDILLHEKSAGSV